MSLNSSKTDQKDPSGSALMRGQQVNRPVQYRFRNGNAKDLLMGPRPLWCRCTFSFGGFLLLFFNKHVLLWVVGGGGFHDNWDLVFQEILP